MSSPSPRIFRRKSAEAEADMAVANSANSLFVHDTPEPDSIKDNDEITGGDPETIAAAPFDLPLSENDNSNHHPVDESIPDDAQDSAVETTVPGNDEEAQENPVSVNTAEGDATMRHRLEELHREMIEQFKDMPVSTDQHSRDDEAQPEPLMLFGEVPDPAPTFPSVHQPPTESMTSTYLTKGLRQLAREDDDLSSSLNFDDEDDDRPVSVSSSIAKSSESSRKRSNSASEEDEESARPKQTAQKSGKHKQRKVQDDEDFRKTSKPSRRSRKRKNKASGNQRDSSNTIGPLLTGTNVFRSQRQTAHLPEPTRFAQDAKDKNKTNAFKSYVKNALPKYKVAAREDCRTLNSALRKFDGQGAVRAKIDDGTWLLRGMTTGLKPFQVVGAAFMRHREKAEFVRGGIIADEMGLGKTVQMLANIMNSLPNLPEDGPRATLIVANRAILTQWQTELRKHCKSQVGRDRDRRYGYGKIVTHYSGHRLKLQDEEIIAELEDAHIVFTTYSEISTSFPQENPPINMTTAEEKRQWWNSHYEKNKGIFLRARFLRVVLDEAHCIKNHDTRISRACRHIDAVHRWALTGTPVLNGIWEYYALFLFLKVPLTGSFQIFKENFCDDSEGSQKLTALLSKYMLRRTHSSTFCGAKLLSLPRASEAVLYLEFTEVERTIYDIVAKRFIDEINSILLSDDTQKQRCRHIWTLVLRLRQITSHVLLAQETITSLFQLEDYEKLNRVAVNANRAAGPSDDRLLRQIAHALDMANSEQAQALGGSDHSEVMQRLADIPPTAQASNTGGNHGRSADFTPYISEVRSSTKWQEILRNTECAGCHQVPRDPMITSCFHIYCSNCATRLQHDAARAGHGQAMCLICQTPYTSVKKCLEALEEVEEEDGESDSGAAKPRKNSSLPSWLTLPGEMISSAKTRGVKMQILKWLSEDPDVKIIVYTQFIHLVRIMARICREEGWHYVTYHGSMDHSAREQAIVKFSDPEQSKSIMLASLKSGGQGLNLTVAARVIIVDPWWNSAIEQQGFCRVYRIGQVRTSQLARMVVRDTIDDKMEAIKRRKDLEINSVMDNPSLSDSLEFNELLKIFGQVGHDTTGRPFIIANSEIQGNARVARDGSSIANQLNQEGNFTDEP